MSSGVSFDALPLLNPPSCFSYLFPCPHFFILHFLSSHLFPLPSVPKMMNETLTYLEGRQEKDQSFSYEVIIVNDGSPDGTAEQAMKFVSEYGTEKVRLLDLVRNRGKGGAVRMVS